MHTPHTAPRVRTLAGVLLAASLALAGCGGAADAGGGSAKAASGGRPEQAGALGTPGATADHGNGRTPRATPVLAPGSVIRTAFLTLEVRDVAKALAAARRTAEEAGGFVGDETTNRDAGGHEHTRVVLRVPAERYDEVLTGLQGTGRLVGRTAKAVDVSDRMVDVDSRIKSQRASVDRVRALMDRATRLSDVVALEGELSSRQADLESLLARRASLKDRVDLATVTLSLSKTPARQASGDGTPGFTDALAGGWHAFAGMLRWIALALGAALPFAALAALLALLWLRAVRPRLPRRAEPVPAMSAPGPLPSARPAPDAAEGAGRD
ncbi:DUF4349 domain-containing protein [Streptomyces sp. NRRL S-1022]|uniref:DUF4349 domain-containing protein n=1 Tax=Streptomyces sp. NRRL S-1022 TaxID=1463880 RepID=UPI0004BEE8B7|nr:DUF4349 domain-containing protein [Streptomyces sp. NRRL S-1022]